MPRAKQFSAVEKTQIQCWHHEGISSKEITGRLGRNAPAVRKIVAAVRDIPTNVPPPAALKRSGRPRLATSKAERRLKLYVQKYPFKTTKELKREVHGWHAMSVRRIQMTLKERLGLPARSAATKPLLTPAMVRKRLAFCKNHLFMTEDDWENVMFSDESMFRLINPRAQTVRRSSTQRWYLQKFTVKKMKHPASVMIWGCFSGKGGQGSLYFLPLNCTMKMDRYMSVLEEKLFPWMGFHHVTQFLQDRAPCHKAKRATALLATQDFTVMDWPGNSPDLNLIENLWSIMKRKLKSDHTITSLPMLHSALKRMWVSNLEPSLFKKLARSMPKRLRDCIANQGQMTKY